MQEKIIKLTQTELNELFDTINEEEPNYALILKLQYLYGRNISEVYNLKKQDVNKEENTITFIMNGKELVYQIHKEIKQQLFDTIENTDKEYIFQEGNRPLTTIKDGINYYLHRKTEALNNLPFLEGLRLTTKDFKALRGQHLYAKGITLKTIHEFYNNSNMDGTKKTIQYEELKEELFPDDISKIIEDTCFKVYTEHEFNNNPVYYVTQGEEHEAIIEIDEENIKVYGDEDLGNTIERMDNKKLLKLLKCADTPGKYIYYDDVKFLRN